MRMNIRLVVAMAVLALSTGTARAHPIPRSSHDRTLNVRLTPDAVIVEYGLEVDLWTLVYQDLPQVMEASDQEKLSEEKEFIRKFTELFGPRLANGLRASIDGERLKFTLSKASSEVKEDHLRCDFVFRAPWKPKELQLHTLAFEEANFLDAQGLAKPGKVVLTFATEAGVGRLRETEFIEPRTPEERLRSAARVFEVGDFAPSAETAPTEETKPRAGSESGLTRLFLQSEYGIVVLLLLSAFLGAAHAFTPGHGKTLVAAYLVGERGTIWHAVVLGLVTTLTHTGSVLVLALVLQRLYPDGGTEEERASIQRTVELVGGLLIAGLGLWLLSRRLTGQADHVHFGGGHHHHHGDECSHSHGGAGHSHGHPVQGGWWGLVLLGVTGGIVPCWDAVILLGAALALNMLWWALPMLLAFSAGLAAVLIAIGILVVCAKNLAGSRWEEKRIFKLLPLISAVLVTSLGLGLCYKAVQGM